MQREPAQSALPSRRWVHAELFARAVPIKRTRQRKEKESEKEKAQRELFNSLVKAVYGDAPGHFAEGEWGVAASEIVRRNPEILQKFLPMQSLTQKARATACRAAHRLASLMLAPVHANPIMLSSCLCWLWSVPRRR